MAKKLGLDTCHQCGDKIENIDNFSIEHKKPWLDSNDPLGLFFDLDNIGFSHLRCNSNAARRGTRNNKVIHGTPNGFGHCSYCGEDKHADEMIKCKTDYSGLDNVCKKCKSVLNKKRRNQKAL